MQGTVIIEIQNEVIKCIKYGMKDSNSIFQKVLDTVPSALSNTETEMLVYDMVKILL